ncbi:hypothetical protein [Bosea sp. Root670]|uniref:hypothetical protein n=1 Tax=Bosea sp. Root670 TaxID=1736583 RepID=UPI0012E3642B|nr:hypothetical protein [Bosea sp. Root670]
MRDERIEIKALRHGEHRRDALPALSPLEIAALIDREPIAPADVLARVPQARDEVGLAEGRLEHG